MFKHYFELIEGIAIWPIISLVIFFVFFSGLLVYIFFIDKEYVKKMRKLPLEEDSLENETILRQKLENNAC